MLVQVSRYNFGTTSGNLQRNTLTAYSNTTGPANLTSHQSSSTNETLRHHPAVSCQPAGGSAPYQSHSIRVNANTVSINHVSFTRVKFLLCPADPQPWYNHSISGETNAERWRTRDGGGSGRPLRSTDGRHKPRTGKCGEHQTLYFFYISTSVFRLPPAN